VDWEREWERLNPYQREAVTDENKACLVSANVGSGKTTVLTAKILYLHEVKHVSYRDMVVLTFTNKAASEIRERLVRADPSVTPEETENFGTFHGVALGLLKKRLPVETLGYTKDFMVMEPDEELELTHRAASRQIFVNGALHIARLLPGRPKGVYDLQKILFGA